MFFCKPMNTESIFYGAKRKQVLAVYSGQIRSYWLCTGRKNQFIVAFFKFFAGVKITDGDSLAFYVNVYNFMLYLNINAETSLETLRCLQSQFFRIFYYPSNIIGQATVCIRNIAGTLKNSNFSVFV